MRSVRRWLAFAAVASAFGLSGAFCSASFRDGMSVATETEAVGYMVFSALLALMAALGVRVVLFVQQAGPMRDD
jgi:hypothetical protein